MSKELNIELNAQGVLQPGEEGWWRVWGASVSHIRPGDAVCTKDEDWFLVTDIFTAKAHPLRCGFMADGEQFTLGALLPVMVMRRGTHNILA